MVMGEKLITSYEGTLQEKRRIESSSSPTSTAVVDKEGGSHVTAKGHGNLPSSASIDEANHHVFILPQKL